MGDFRDWQTSAPPSGLAPTALLGPAGRALQGGLGDVKDSLVAATKAAVKARLPLLAPRGALDLLGAERCMVRGVAETDAAFAARVAAAWTSLAQHGSAQGVLQQLYAMAPSARTYDLIYGQTVVQIDSAGTITTSTIGAAGTAWHHVGLVFPVAAQAPAQTAQNSEVDAIRQLMRLWLPAFCVLDAITVIVSGNTWSLPARTWGAGGTWADGTVFTWSP